MTHWTLEELPSNKETSYRYTDLYENNKKVVSAKTYGVAFKYLRRNMEPGDTYREHYTDGSKSQVLFYEYIVARRDYLSP